jgi:hypothetical protein
MDTAVKLYSLSYKDISLCVDFRYGERRVAPTLPFTPKRRTDVAAGLLFYADCGV